MGDSGVFNIINTRTGRTYTASSDTDIDRLMDKYRSDLKNRSHHNHGLRNDARKGDNFRFKVVARNCSSRNEVLQIREAEIYKNRNNTYNEDVLIHFEGGNPFGSPYSPRRNKIPTSDSDSHMKKSSKYSKPSIKKDMKICSKCGHENSIHRTYCERCGTNFPKEKMSIWKRILHQSNERKKFEIYSLQSKPIVDSDLTIKELGEILCKILDFNGFKINGSNLVFDYNFYIYIPHLEKFITTLNLGIYKDLELEKELKKFIETDNFKKRLGNIISEYCEYFYKNAYWDLINQDTVLIFKRRGFGIDFENVDEIPAKLNKEYYKLYKKRGWGTKFIRNTNIPEDTEIEPIENLLKILYNADLTLYAKLEIKQKIEYGKVYTKQNLSQNINEFKLKYDMKNIDMDDELEEDGIFVCPECGFKSDYFKYCPHCSIRMKKEKNQTKKYAKIETQFKNKKIFYYRRKNIKREYLPIKFEKAEISPKNEKKNTNKNIQKEKKM